MNARAVSIRPLKLRDTPWQEFAVRFVFGGGMAAAAGWIASRYGPGLGGLFLAFPAIFPASITLVEKHSGKSAARHDAEGAVLGAAGLLLFGLAVWLLAPVLPGWLVLGVATLTWSAAGLLLWTLVPESPHMPESESSRPRA